MLNWGWTLRSLCAFCRILFPLQNRRWPRHHLQCTQRLVTAASLCMTAECHWMSGPPAACSTAVSPASGGRGPCWGEPILTSILGLYHESQRRGLLAPPPYIRNQVSPHKIGGTLALHALWLWLYAMHPANIASSAYQWRFWRQLSWDNLFKRLFRKILHRFFKCDTAKRSFPNWCVFIIS